MLFLSVNVLGRWSSVVRSMGCHFLVRGQQGVVEDWVYMPGLWEDQFTVGHRGGDDFEGAMLSGC